MMFIFTCISFNIHINANDDDDEIAYFTVR